MRIAALLFLISLQASAISLIELCESYNGYMMPVHWKALGGTLKRSSIHTALKGALDTNAELEKRINNLENIHKKITQLMNFPTSELMTWQILIYGEMQKLRNIRVKPLPPADSMGFDMVDEHEATDQSDSK